MSSTNTNNSMKRKRSEVGGSENNECLPKSNPKRKGYVQQARLLVKNSVTDIENSVADLFQGFDQRLINLEAKFTEQKRANGELRKGNNELEKNMKKVNQELKKVNQELKKLKCENKSLNVQIATLQKSTSSPLNPPTIGDSYVDAEDSSNQPFEGNVSMEIAALPDEEDKRFKCNYCNEIEKDLLCFSCTNKSIEGAKNGFIEAMEKLPATQLKPQQLNESSDST